MIKQFTKLTLVVLVFFYGTAVFSQSAFFRNNPVNWNEFTSVEVPKHFDNYKDDDLIYIEDNAEFRFISGNRHLMRLITLRINTEKGLQELSNFRLPESFDLADNVYFYKQGRRARIKIPNLTEYKIEQFSARKFTSGQWQQLQFKDKYEQVRWIKTSGEFADEDATIFQLQNIKIGDVVQLYYDASFKGTYSSNLFYFYSRHPKIKVNYIFVYDVDKMDSHYNYLLAMNVKDSCFSRSQVAEKDKIIFTDKFVFRNINGINYPANSNEGKKLPHAYLNLNFMRMFTGTHHDNGLRINDYAYVKPQNFEWIVISDTTNSYVKIYDKHFNALRKYVATFPPLHNDSNNTAFFKAFFDTINSYRYITRNQLFYNESNLINATTMEHINRRRLVGSPGAILKDILDDNGIFYYIANIQDRRYGEHNPYYRAHYSYEWEITAIPNNNSYIYFMARHAGVPYFPNELPFYLEGSLASLFPKNFQEADTAKSKKIFKFIKTHKGTFNENTRTENASVKISLSEHKAEYAGKESLSGQFSTVLRHLYLNEIIDSTIAPYYFKRCTDKPLASDVKIKLSSKITDFPFRYTFNCSEKIALPHENKLSLNNWFSFLFSSKTLPEVPTHDYFFDFDFSDAYNFMLEFDKPVEIKNANDFFRNMNNKYFELSSEIVKNSETSYLVKVKLILKQMAIPLSDMQLLTDLVKELDAINSFSVEW